jgi:hypothetical protein
MEMEGAKTSNEGQRNAEDNKIQNDHNEPQAQGFGSGTQPVEIPNGR